MKKKIKSLLKANYHNQVESYNKDLFSFKTTHKISLDKIIKPKKFFYLKLQILVDTNKVN